MKTRNTPLAAFTLIIIFLLSVPLLKAQTLWSPAFIGGPTNGGTLIKMNPDGSGFIKLYDFSEATGSSPMGSLLQASNGKLYGTCINGGTDSSCVIYSYDPTTQTYTDLWNFDIFTGDFPMSGMVQAPNGKLYGAASSGGVLSQGVIYSFDVNTNTYT
ncbi:MAG: hypothetical protein JWO06_888, partial [Bacteroidota bacterium]|nr:hypothetical protein [Bacteroidota bacterium]